MPDFYPPKLSPLFARLVQSVAPLIAHTQYRMRLELPQEDLDRLAALRDHRLLLLPNHPTHHDWVAIFLLSARLGELFHYIAAHERFGSRGGEFLQLLGAYSIRRGLGDRPSVIHTIHLLMQPQARLVIFPEGGFSFQNDTVMPFRPGPVQLAFQSMSRLFKQGEDLPDLYAVPISLKYRYLSSMNAAIDAMLSRLEQTVGVEPKGDFYSRLVTVADCVLLQYEQDYGLLPAAIGRSRNDRIEIIKTHLLQTCEQKLSITPAPHDSLRERVYRIQRVLEARAEDFADTDLWTYETIHTAAARLLNFNAIYDGYVAANPTPERFLDTLTRLERAVFGIDQPLPKGDRAVVVRIGEPINLKNHFEGYQKHRQETVDHITETLRLQVQRSLDESS